MKFQFECEESDGLVLIDASYLKELNSNMLYAFEVLLDRHGKSELIYDFPDEKWDVVRKRETAELIEFCNSGKMVVFLLDNDVTDCELTICNNIGVTAKYLNIPSGKLIAVNANELIQCVSYPDLEMEIILELEVEEGGYAITNDSIKQINCCKCSTDNLCFENVEEL